MSKIYKNWFVHNMFGHPLMELSKFLSFFNPALSKYLQTKFHDGTLPEYK